ncbi:TrbI/VirB10 family protein [Stenotrophomonas sp. C3(2023)]|uniref:TrbI/VirB10 family protein n=1 Tax=Stenotrophomonas sp. C3(2023) TaxID=3080277 RepID=UPI00293CE66F|nr:TrbI/VirB10 family protein [Stenotrophomonas sp. C3(2023)]MDV3468454.1 TrbI/VirB10 family protein [Stenotrophomonas sp. C3(2023)]
MSNHDQHEDQAPQRAEDASVTATPYKQHVDAATPPDLDAAAPRLRSAEERRMNRKALMFLAALAVLMVGMGTLMWSKLRGDKQAPAPVREVARVATPALPTVAPTLEPEQPAQTPSMAVPLPLLPAPPVPEAPMQLGLQAEAPARERGPSLMERRMAGGNATSGGEGGGRPAQQAGAAANYAEMMRAAMGASGIAQQPEASPSRGPDVADVAQVGALRNPDTLLVRGSYLRCVLETRIITDNPGFTSCLVTEPVYSVNGRTMLLPKGSKILGRYGGGPNGERVSVIWDRITTPNGLDVAMSSPGIDNLGGAGHPGDYSAHWAGRITSALMISLLADGFKYAAAENGPASSSIGLGGVVHQKPYESATARTMERLAVDALSSRRPPTVTINQGEIVTVYVAKDLDFSAVLPSGRG